MKIKENEINNVTDESNSKNVEHFVTGTIK